MSANAVTQGVRPRVKQRLFRSRPEDALPHIATHHRVYIVPTKRGFAFLCALLLMLVASVNYSLSLGYALSFILTGLFAASLLHTYKNLAGIEVQGIEAIHGFSGDRVVFKFALHNAARDSRQGIRVCTQHGKTSTVSIAPHETCAASLSIPANTRGRLQLGRLTLQSDWPVGLWTCWSYLHVPVDALVYPKPEHNPPPLPSQPSEDASAAAIASLDGEVSGVRGYRPGDSMNTIAWKQAAKGGGLQVRTFENSHSPIAAAFTLPSTGHSELEDQLSRLSAWVIQAHASHAAYSVELPGVQLTHNTGELQYRRALKSLALHGETP